MNIVPTNRDALYRETNSISANSVLVHKWRIQDDLLYIQYYHINKKKRENQLRNLCNNFAKPHTALCLRI